MTLQQVVEVALRNNGEMKSLREEAGVHEAEKIRAGLRPNPVLELEGATGAFTGSSAENSLSIGVSQEFLLAGKRERKLAVADRELDAYRWQVAERERLLREEVKTGFFDLLLAEQRLGLSRQVSGLNRQLLDLTRERLTAGDIPELEVDLVKVELARSEGARIEAERDLTQKRTRLVTLMGGAAGAEPTPSGSLAQHLKLPKTLVELKDLALSDRPDLKKLRAEKSQGEAGVSLAKAEAIPNLTAGLALKRDRTSMEIAGVEGRDTAYTVAVRLSMPLPVFDSNQAGIREARAKLSSSETRLAAAQSSALLEVEYAWAGLENAEKVLSLYRSDIIPQMEANLELTREAYSVGELGILAIIEEQKKFYEVSSGYLAAQHAWQTALVKLEAAVGTELNGGVR